MRGSWLFLAFLLHGACHAASAQPICTVESQTLSSKVVHCSVPGPLMSGNSNSS